MFLIGFLFLASATSNIISVYPEVIRSYVIGEAITFELRDATDPWGVGDHVEWVVSANGDLKGNEFKLEKLQGKLRPDQYGVARLTLEPGDVALLGPLTQNTFFIYAAGDYYHVDLNDNPPVGITLESPTFTAEPSDIPYSFAEETNALRVTLKEIGPTETWERNVDIKLRVSSAEDGISDYFEQDTVATTEQGVVVVVFDMNSLQWNALNIQSRDDKIYVFACLESEIVYNTIPARISFVHEFSVSPSCFFEYDDPQPTMCIIPADGAWNTQKMIKVKVSETLLGDKSESGDWESNDLILFQDGRYPTEYHPFYFRTPNVPMVYVYIAISLDGDTYTWTLDPVPVANQWTEFRVWPTEILDTQSRFSGGVEVTEDLTGTAKFNYINVFFSSEELIKLWHANFRYRHQADSGEDPGKYLFENAEHQLPLIRSSDFFYVYASYTNIYNEQVFFKHPRTIAITDDSSILRFEISPTAIHEDKLRTHEALIITQTIGKRWGRIRLGFTCEHRPDETHISDFIEPEENGSYIFPWWTVGTFLDGAAAGQKIFIGVDTEGEGTFLDKKAEVLILTGILSSIEPTHCTLDDWEEGANFTVTVAANVTWTESSEIFITKLEDPLSSYNNIIKEYLQLDEERKVSFTITKRDREILGAVEEPTTLYVYINEDWRTRVRQSATKLTITSNPPEPEFTVTPTVIHANKNTFDRITITPKNAGAGWTSKKIAFAVSDLAPSPATNANVAQVFGVATMSEGAIQFISESVSLDGWTLIPGKKLFIYVSKTEEQNFLPGAVRVEIMEPAATSFSIAPTEMLFHPSLQTPLIVLTPLGGPWPTEENDWFLARLSHGPAGNARIVDVPIEVGGSTDEPEYRIPAGVLLHRLEITEADLPATVALDVQWCDGKYMDAPVEFTINQVTHGAAMGVTPLGALFLAMLLLFTAFL